MSRSDLDRSIHSFRPISNQKIIVIYKECIGESKIGKTRGNKWLTSGSATNDPNQRKNPVSMATAVKASQSVSAASTGGSEIDLFVQYEEDMNSMVGDGKKEVEVAVTISGCTTRGGGCGHRASSPVQSGYKI
jgi:hypothetical protein